MADKKSFSAVELAFEKVGLELLETVYTNSTTKMECKCPKHPNEKLEMSYRVVARGSGCKFCGRVSFLDKTRHGIDKVREDFSKAGYELLSTKYWRANDSLKYCCPKHPKEELSMSYTSLKNGSRCPYCNGKATLDEVETAFRERGYTPHNLVDYVNSKSKIEYTCPNHPDKELNITYGNLKSGKGCPYCAGNCVKYTLTQVSDKFAERGYRLTSTEYLNVHENLTYICGKHPNIEQKITFTNFLSGQGCSVCKQSKGEKLIADYLTEKGVQFTTQYRIKDCRDKLPLPFDFAVFDENGLNFLIEFDGIQHFREVVRFRGRGSYENTKRRDRIKDSYCDEKGLRLVRISYNDDIQEKLKALPF